MAENNNKRKYPGNPIPAFPYARATGPPSPYNYPRMATIPNIHARPPMPRPSSPLTPSATTTTTTTPTTTRTISTTTTTTTTPAIARVTPTTTASTTTTPPMQIQTPKQTTTTTSTTSTSPSTSMISAITTTSNNQTPTLTESPTATAASDGNNKEFVLDFLQSYPETILEMLMRNTSKKPTQNHNSLFTRLLNSNTLLDSQSASGRLFFIKFRIAYINFLELVKLCEPQQSKIFPFTFNSDVSLEFKLLICLRLLAKGLDFNEVSELSGISAHLCQSIFYEFIEGFVKENSQTFIQLPENKELTKVNQLYSMVGFPGACGALDTISIRWEKCSTLMKKHFKSSTGYYPQLNFQMIVDHNRNIFYVSELASGHDDIVDFPINDLQFVSLKDKLHNRLFALRKSDGKEVYGKGAYFLASANYPGSSGLLRCNQSQQFHDGKLRFNEFLIHLQRDVNQVYDMLKNRFHALDHAGNYSDFNHITNIIQTCAIIHNFDLKNKHLLSYDWEKNFDWKEASPDLAEEVIFGLQFRRVEETEIVVQEVEEIEETPEMAGKITNYSYSTRGNLESDLFEHFKHVKEQKQLQFPQRMNENQKRLLV